MTAATEVLPPGGTTVFATRSALWLFWQRFREDKAAVGAAVVILLLIVIAIVGGPLAAWATGHPNNQALRGDHGELVRPPERPELRSSGSVPTAPGAICSCARMYGARTSLIVGVVASGIAVLIGLVVGLIAGYFRGFVDTALSRVGDVMLAMPQLLISIGIVAACNSNANGCLDGLIQPGLPLVIAVIVIFSWPYIARLVRGFTLSIREKEFVEASRSLGASDLRIIFREILPEPGSARSSSTRRC